MFPAAAAVIFVLAGLFAMLGLGGGILYTPVLTWLGFDVVGTAIPVSLLLNGLTTLSAAVAYGRSGMVDWRGGLPLAATSLAAAPMGALGTRHLPTDAILTLLALAMAASGGRMLATARGPEPDRRAPPAKRAALSALAGVGIGLIAGLLGIGGGFLIVPLLLALGYPTKRAAATSAFVVTFASFSGFAGHAALGDLPWGLIAASGAAVVVASHLGARLMRDRMNSRWLKPGFGVLLLAVAAKLTMPVIAG